MKTVYRTFDGLDFDTQEDATAHEDDVFVDWVAGEAGVKPFYKFIYNGGIRFNTDLIILALKAYFQEVVFQPPQHEEPPVEPGEEPAPLIVFALRDDRDVPRWWLFPDLNSPGVSRSLRAELGELTVVPHSRNHPKVVAAIEGR